MIDFTKDELITLLAAIDAYDNPVGTDIIEKINKELSIKNNIISAKKNFIKPPKSEVINMETYYADKYNLPIKNLYTLMESINDNLHLYLMNRYQYTQISNDNIRDISSKLSYIEEQLYKLLSSTIGYKLHIEMYCEDYTVYVNTVALDTNNKKLTVEELNKIFIPKAVADSAMVFIERYLDTSGRNEENGK